MRKIILGLLILCCVFVSNAQVFNPVSSTITTGIKVDVPNMAANGNVLTAATSVDVNGLSTLNFIQTTSGITATLLNPVTTIATHKTISLTNTGSVLLSITTSGGDNFTINNGQTVQGYWNGTAWRLVNPAQVLPEFGEVILSSIIAPATTANTLIGTVTLPSAGTWKVDYIANLTHTYENSTTFKQATALLYLRDGAGTIVPNSYGIGGESFVSSASNTAGQEIKREVSNGSVQIITTGAATYTLRLDAGGGGNNQAVTVNGGANGSSKIIYQKISGYSAAQGQSVASGQVILANQVFSTNAFVASSNGTYNITTAGKYLLSYDILTDGTGANTNSQFAIFDAIGTVVSGTERTRGGGVTTSQVLTATAEVIVNAPTTYTLRARNGGSGSVTVLNGLTGQSQISWQQLGTSAWAGLNLTTSGSGAATYNSATSTLNIPVSASVASGESTWSNQNFTAAETDVVSFTLPTVGTYVINADPSITTTATTAQTYVFKITNNANVEVCHQNLSVTDAVATQRYPTPIIARITTTTANEIYKFRISNAAATGQLSASVNNGGRLIWYKVQ